MVLRPASSEWPISKAIALVKTTQPRAKRQEVPAERPLLNWPSWIYCQTKIVVPRLWLRDPPIPLLRNPQSAGLDSTWHS